MLACTGATPAIKSAGYETSDVIPPAVPTRPATAPAPTRNSSRETGVTGPPLPALRTWWTAGHSPVWLVVRYRPGPPRSVPQDRDGGEAAAGPGGAVGEEVVRGRPGVDRHVMDVSLFDTGRAELSADRGRQVERGVPR